MDKYGYCNDSCWFLTERKKGCQTAMNTEAYIVLEVLFFNFFGQFWPLIIRVVQ